MQKISCFMFRIMNAASLVKHSNTDTCALSLWLKTEHTKSQI